MSTNCPTLFRYPLTLMFFETEGSIVLEQSCSPSLVLVGEIIAFNDSALSPKRMGSFRAHSVLAVLGGVRMNRYSFLLLRSLMVVPSAALSGGNQEIAVVMRKEIM